MDSCVHGNCAVCCPRFVHERAHWELTAVCLMESVPLAEDWAACVNFCGHKLVVKPKARAFFQREKLAARFSEKFFPAFSNLAAPRDAQSTDAVLMLAQLPAELCSSAPGRYGSTKHLSVSPLAASNCTSDTGMALCLCMVNFSVSYW